MLIAGKFWMLIDNQDSLDPMKNCPSKWDNSSSSSSSNMYLHTEVVLIALSGLAHFRIARLFAILGRTWRMNECSAHHRAFGSQQPPRFELSIDRFKQYRRQFVLFQKMTEIQYRGLARQSIGNPAKSRKPAHALDLVQGISHLPVRQVEPVLQAVDAKHAPQHHRLTAPAVHSWGNAVQCATAILARV